MLKHEHRTTCQAFHGQSSTTGSRLTVYIGDPSWSAVACHRYPSCGVRWLATAFLPPVLVGADAARQAAPRQSAGKPAHSKRPALRTPKGLPCALQKACTENGTSLLLGAAMPIESRGTGTATPVRDGRVSHPAERQIHVPDVAEAKCALCQERLVERGEGGTHFAGGFGAQVSHPTSGPLK